MLDTIKQYAKFITALLTVIASSFAGLIPADWGPWLQAVIALTGAISVLVIPNQLTTAQVDKHLNVDA